ncbi:hypothetical protein FIBSPDRAFT_859381, partial [Athelia psychrophila]
MSRVTKRLPNRGMATVTYRPFKKNMNLRDNDPIRLIAQVSRRSRSTQLRFKLL